MAARDPVRPVVAIAVGLLSGAVLGYEILLIRLFSIVDWHHFAFLVISLALLGYGASGTFLALYRDVLLRRWAATSAAAAAAFGFASIGAFLLSQHLDFNSLEIIWSRRQAGTLFLLYLLFAIPFFCAATAIAVMLSRFGEHSPRIYRADLVGGGCSSAAMTGLLFVVHPVTCVQIVGLAGFTVAALFALQVDGRFVRASAVAILLGGIAAIAATRPIAFPLRVSQFKELSQTLRIPGAAIVEERSSPLALLSIVQSPQVPFRFAPGLSLNYAGEIPEQIGVFSDASSMTAINRFGVGSSPAYLDFLPSAVPYHLGRRVRKVAVIGAGGGSEVLSALAHGTEEVTAVELNPQMVDLVARRFKSFSGDLYGDRRVRVAISEARRFVRESSERYDVIQIALVDSFGASLAGVQALSESHLYTVEAVEDFVGHLGPDGCLVITRWMQVPPRDMVKLFATADIALERLQLSAAPRVAMLRSWNTASLVVKRDPLNAEEIAALRAFCNQRSFDLDYAPGVSRAETNRYNVMDDSYLYDAASAVLAGKRSRDDFFDRYKFFIRPATDERPYFFHFFKWRVLPELLRLRARGGMPLIEWGYLVLIAGLIQALVASIVLILIPLLSLRRVREPLARLIIYFASIGLAFFFLEIAFIQRLTLFLGHPLYAVAVVLSSFLVFAGIGSGVSSRWSARWSAIPAAVAAAAIVELVVVRILVGTTLGLHPAIKVLASIAVIAPLAFLMGMPFPNGLERLSRTDPAAIPWAWAINGTASVLSTMFATLIAIHFGFSALVASAALLYAIAGWSGVARSE